MPHHLSSEPGLIRIAFFGHVAPGELQEVLGELEAVEQTCTVIPDRLTDLSEITSAGFTAANMMTMVARRKATIFPNSFRSAVVAPRKLDLGFARMFQILNTHPQITVEIFSSVEAGQRWLDGGPTESA